MRTSIHTIVALSLATVALSACGKTEVKTGSLTQNYSMMDPQGVQFGTVSLDPINGGIIRDAQGRTFARVIPYVEQTAALQ